MSRFKVEQLCFRLTEKTTAEKFKSNPDAFMEAYSLTDQEKAAIRECDIGTLYKMGVLTQAISALSRVFGNNNATYVRRLRDACGLPENAEQMDVLQKRGR